MSKFVKREIMKTLISALPLIALSGIASAHGLHGEENGAAIHAALHLVPGALIGLPILALYFAKGIWGRS